MLTVALIAAMPTIAPQVALAATALIMGGAGHPLSTPPDTLPFVNRYTNVGVEQYITPAFGTPSNVVVVVTPQARLLGFGFDPFFTFRGLFDGPFDKAVREGQQNLDRCITGEGTCVYNTAASGQAPNSTDEFIVYGYSQSSAVATLEKRELMARYPHGGGPTVSFMLTANGNRPNGGILARGPEGLTIPIAGLTFNGSTPTDSQYATVDIARQYDGWADQPTNPLNLLAEVNALFGVYYLHQNYDDVSFGDRQFQDKVGDTAYYLVPTDILPLLIPLDQVPVIGHPLADTLDPVLRVLVETGYDRTISPGTPTQWKPFYFPDPVVVVKNLAEAVPTGLDNGIEDITDQRPLGTSRPGPYGVGGPPVNVRGLEDPYPVEDNPAGGQAVSDKSIDTATSPPSAAPQPELTATVTTPSDETEQPPAKPVRSPFPRFDQQFAGHDIRNTQGGATPDESGGTDAPKNRPHDTLGSRLDAVRQSVQSAVKNATDREPASADTN